MTASSDHETAELEEAGWHRKAAIAAFNGAWDLIDRKDRTDEDDRRMLLLACTSRSHWGEAGGEQQHAIGDWQVAYVLSLLGDGKLALNFAKSSLATVEAHGWTDFTLASAYEGIARAYAVLGDKGGRDQYAALCREVLETLPEEDQEIVGGQLASVPEL
jgi:hypothetical protein